MLDHFVKVSDIVLPHIVSQSRSHMLMFFWTKAPSPRIIESNCTTDPAVLITVVRVVLVQVEGIFPD